MNQSQMGCIKISVEVERINRLIGVFFFFNPPHIERMFVVICMKDLFGNTIFQVKEGKISWGITVPWRMAERDEEGKKE